MTDALAGRSPESAPLVVRAADGAVPPGARLERIARIAAPLLIGLAALAAWEAAVRINHIPHYILPGPDLVLQSLVRDWGVLWPSLLVTLQVARTGRLQAGPGSLAPAGNCASRRQVLDFHVPQVSLSREPGAGGESPPPTRCKARMAASRT